MPETLILVDARNRRTGQADKRTVHERGLLHRAFSIFLVDRAGAILLQQRHPAKYHSGGLWANSCCGHPRPGELTRHAAHRRLGEELGASAPLRFRFRTHYRAGVANGLIENEIVYVYFGAAPAALESNPAEISALRRTSLRDLQRDARQRPEAYAVWLRFYLSEHATELAAGVDAVIRGLSGQPGGPSRGRLQLPVTS